MITEPLFKDAPTFRNYEDYLYGEAYTKGWNDAMRFIFGLEIAEAETAYRRANLKVVSESEERE